MILYGRNLSPFVRRVAIWCALQDRPLERRKITVAGEDFETLRAFNPVVRVPALVLDDGDVLIESGAIVDWLEDTAEHERRLIPATGPDRRICLQHIAHANATAEKSVALVYDKVRRPEEYHYAPWIERIEGQIAGGLAAMESRLDPEGGWFGGARLNGADVNFVIAYDFVKAMHPHLAGDIYPGLERMLDRANEMPVFAETRPET